VANDATEFLQACGQSGPLRLALDLPGSQGVLYRDFPHPYAVIGQKPGNDLVLEDPAVSSHHAYLQAIAGRVFCLDLRSRTGTRWDNGTDGSGWLTPGRSVRIGPYRIRLADLGMDPVAGLGDPLSPLDARPGPDDGAPYLLLQFRRNHKPGLWRMGRLLALVGTSSRCKVQLIDASVSRFHCSLVRTEYGAWVVDLGGGVRLNRTTVAFARLQEGDTLSVGKYRLRVRYEAATSEGSQQDASIAEVVLNPEPEPLLPVPLSRRDGFSNLVSVTGPPVLLSDPTALIGPLQAGGSEVVLQQLVTQLSMLQQQMFTQNQQAMMIMCQMFNVLYKDHQGTVREEMNRLQQITQELQTLQARLAEQKPQPREQPAAPPKSSANPGEAPTVPEAAGTRPQQANSISHPVESDVDPKAVHAWLAQRVALLQREQQTLWQKLSNSLRGMLAGGS
jgi:pSer/pThr/pTyr-binding forkhead associated (FHA) protein